VEGEDLGVVVAVAVVDSFGVAFFAGAGFFFAAAMTTG